MRTSDRSRAVARGLLALLAAVAIAGCTFLEDNGTHLAYALEKGAKDLRASPASEIIVRYETLDGRAQGYYVEITPSQIDPARPSGGGGSYLVVSGTTSGGTSYHNRFVFVPQRLFLRKDQGGPTDVVLRKDGDRISVVELR